MVRQSDIRRRREIRNAVLRTNRRQIAKFLNMRLREVSALSRRKLEDLVTRKVDEGFRAPQPRAKVITKVEGVVGKVDPRAFEVRRAKQDRKLFGIQKTEDTLQRAQFKRAKITDLERRKLAKRRADLPRFVEDKPVWTLGTGLRILGKEVKDPAKVKLFKDNTGNVVGISDPFSGQSYRIVPTSEKRVRTKIKELQLGAEKRVEDARKKAIAYEKRKAAPSDAKDWMRLEDKYGKIVEKVREREAKKVEVKSNIKKYLRKIADTEQVIAGKLKIKSKTKFFTAKPNYLNTLVSELALAPVDAAFLPSGLLSVYDSSLFLVQSLFNKKTRKLFLTKDFVKSVWGGQVDLAKSFNPATPEGMANIIITTASVSVQANIARAGGSLSFKSANTLPKTSKFKIGQLIKDKKGNVGIVSKNGRVIRVPAKKAKILLKAEKKGAVIRAKKTEVARLVKKAGKTGLSKKEIASLDRAARIKLNKIMDRDINRLSRQFKLNPKDKATFSKLYKDLKLKPSDKAVLRFKRFSDKIEVDKVVKSLDKDILKGLRPKARAKPKAKAKIAPVRKADPKVKFYKSKGTTKTKVEAFQREVRAKARKLGANDRELLKLSNLAEDIMLKKKGAVAKLDKRFDRLRAAKKTTDISKAVSKSDKLAQKKGFKDSKEQFKYEQAFKDYKKGNTKVESTLRSIEKRIAARKDAFSKQKAKEFVKLRNRVVKEAVAKLKAGQLKIKDKKYTATKVRAPLSTKQAEAIALSVNARLRKVEELKYRRQAKGALNDILKGKRVDTSDRKLHGAIRKLLNDEQLRLLRREKMLRIRAGEIKGKQPRVRLTKAEKRALKTKSKAETKAARIARKKQKRSLAGEAQARKIRRKQLVREMEEEFIIIERLKRGDKNLAKDYLLEIDEFGNLRLRPRRKEARKISFAKDIIKKSRVKKGEVITKKDGTIQVLKTKKVKVSKTKTETLQDIKVKKQKLIQLKRRFAKETPSPKPPKKPTGKPKAPGGRPPAKVKVAKPKLKTVTFTSTSAVIVGLSKSRTRVAQKLAQVQKSLQKQAIESQAAQKIQSALAQAADTLSKLKQDSATMQKVAQDQKISQKQKSALRQNLASINKLITELKTLKRKTQKKKVLKKIRFPELDWQTKLPKGLVRIVEGRVRVRGKIKVVTPKTTPNRALKIMDKLVDNTTSRSFDLIIVGVKKGTDVKKPSLAKYRAKAARKSKVLKIVEKVRHAIDTRGEKRGLTVAKVLRKKVAKKKATKRKTTTRKKKTIKRRSSKKRSR